MRELDEEMHAVGGVLRRENGMGLQGWSSSERSNSCELLICGNPISFVVKVGKCVKDKQDTIKSKGTGNSCGELACLSVNERVPMRGCVRHKKLPSGQ